MAKLVFKHSEKVSDDVETFREQTDTLVHFQVAPYSLVDGLKVWLNPEQLRGIENAAVEVDVDA